MELVFSDGSTTSVSSIEREDYQLTVETERPDVVAFAPLTPMSQPRVIAVSQGRGNLLTVTMHPPQLCGSKVPLSTTHAHVSKTMASTSIVFVLPVTKFDILTAHDLIDPCNKVLLCGFLGRHRLLFRVDCIEAGAHSERRRCKSRNCC